MLAPIAAPTSTNFAYQLPFGILIQFSNDLRSNQAQIMSDRQSATSLCHSSPVFSQGYDLVVLNLERSLIFSTFRKHGRPSGGSHYLLHSQDLGCQRFL